MQAAEMHRCHSLVCIYANEYLLHGGDVKWLKGLCANGSAQTHIPRKFRHLGEINEILAHTPWMIAKGHIAVSICSWRINRNQRKFLFHNVVLN